MRYFTFLHSSRIICLPLNISEKAISLLKASRGKGSLLPSSLLIWYNTHTTWRTRSTIQRKGDRHHFFIPIRSCTWPRSGPFCWQNPHSGCYSEIHLAVAVKYTFFQLFPTPNKSLRFNFNKRDAKTGGLNLQIILI